MSATLRSSTTQRSPETQRSLETQRSTNSSPSNSKLPVRAIISTISTRSSPSIPPALDAYDPLVKHVLRHRLTFYVFPSSFVLCWVMSTVWSIWQMGSHKLGFTGVAFAPFLPVTLLNAVLGWLSMSLPVVVLRKLYLTASRTPATSPRTLLKNALLKPSAKHASTIYVISAVLALGLHVMTAYVYEAEPRLSLFVNSKKHPYYLNGRLVFLLFSQIAVGLAFWLRSVMLDRFVFRWSSSSITSNARYPFRHYDIVRALVVSMFLATVSVPVSAACFGLSRLSLPILYRFPLVPIILRPFTAHFLRSQSSYTILLPLTHLPLLVRAWFLAFTTILTWDVSESLFELFTAQPCTVSHLTPNPLLALISGISSPIPYFRYFAYSELRSIAENKTSSAAEAQRKILFTDHKHNPNLWSRLLRESLILVGKDYQHFLRRGAPPPAPPPPIPTAPTLPLTPIKATPVPLLRQRVFKDKPHSPVVEGALDALSADGPLARAIEQGAEDVPELFRSVKSKALLELPVVPKAKEVVVGRVYGVKAVVAGKVHAVLGLVMPPVASEAWKGVMKWWSDSRLSREVDACLPMKELDMAVIEVISHLTCASLTEDSYGVVQRDIPRILEAFLSFLTAVEDYQSDIVKKYVPPSVDENLSPQELAAREATRMEVEKANEILGYIGDGLKEGVARIVRTFGDKILAFKFPPRTASKLQGFIDYC